MGGSGSKPVETQPLIPPIQSPIPQPLPEPVTELSPPPPTSPPVTELSPPPQPLLELSPPPIPQDSPPVTQAKVSLGDEDFSLLPVCFGKAYNQLLGVNLDSVKKFEHILYIGAEASRLAYCDVGIMKYAMFKAFGLSPDILNKVITHYDWKYLGKRRNITTRGINFTPPASYELEQCADFTNENKPISARYISSPTDTTCVIINPSVLKPNSNSIITESDCIIVFKGSSSIRNWEKNLRSVFSGDLSNEIRSIIPDCPSGIKVATSFVTPIVEIFNEILKAIKEVSPNAKRLFVFGHSKGGAEAELAGTMLSLCMKTLLPLVEQVHVVSYGSPRIVDLSSKDTFNQNFLIKNQGNFTLTRIESVGSLVGDNVTDMPPTMVHPGWGNKTNTLDEIRQKFGGVSITDNKRNPATWPFNEDLTLWDIANKFKLDTAVTTVLGERPIEDKKGGERSTYLRVRGSRWAPNPHMEYFGMFFAGSQRLAGMGNPAMTTEDRKEVPGSNVNKIFVANIFPECTRYKYVYWGSLGSSFDIVNNVKSEGTRIADNAKKLFGRKGGKTYRKKPKQSLKKSRRNSFHRKAQ